MFEITFQSATVSKCDYAGRYVSGLCAVVLKDGVEVFRSQPHTKRYLPRKEAEEFIKRAA